LRDKAVATAFTVLAASALPMIKRTAYAAINLSLLDIFEVFTN
jgi:hypothetical protein